MTGTRRGQVRVGYRGPNVGVTSVPTVNFSSGSARALSQLSGDLLSLSNVFHDQLDAQAAAEGEVSGALQGAAGTPTLENFGTIRGRAHNKAAIEAFTTNLDTNATLKINELSKLHANDPDGFQRALRDYSEGMFGEVRKIAPQAVPALRQRFLTRSLPHIEAARENRFKVLQDRTAAEKLRAEFVTNQEVERVSSGLFSKNPEVSGSAIASLAEHREKLFSILNARDPDGKPLYSETDKTKFKLEFHDKLMRRGLETWFNEQPDKAEAYRRFVTGELTIDLDRGFQPKAKAGGNRVSIANEANRIGVDPRAAIIISSIETGARFSSTAKNPSGALGLFQFMPDTWRAFGTAPTTDADTQIRLGLQFIKKNQETLTNALGREPAVHELYIAHWLGSGGAVPILKAPRDSLAVDVWRANGVYRSDGFRKKVLTQNGLPANATVADVINSRIALVNRHEKHSDRVLEKKITPVAVREQLQPETISKIEDSFRSTIKFENSQHDRDDREQEKEAQSDRDRAEFDFYARINLAGQKDQDTGQVIELPTITEVQRAVDTRGIDASDGRAIISALTTNRPEASSPEVRKEAMRRMHTGEDVRPYVFENYAQLSASDASTLLSQNNSLNVTTADKFSPDQQFYFDRLKDALTPDALLGSLDGGHDQRKASALVEFRKRVNENEPAEEVMLDLVQRADRDIQQATFSKLDTLLTPRFAIPQAGQQGRIDAKATAQRLADEFLKQNISPESYKRQRALVVEWNRLQNLIDKRATRK